MRRTLTKQQIKILRDLLKFASSESPFYKSKFKSLKQKNLKISDYKDFKDIPITTTEEFKSKNIKFLTDTKYIWRIWSTTGTTGKPKLSFAGFDLIKAYKEEIQFMLSQAKIHIEKKEIGAVFFPMTGLAGAGPATVRGLEELGVPVIALGIEAEPSFANLIMKKTPPSFIFMYPSSFLLFTNKLKRINQEFLKDLKIKAIFSTGEPLTKNMRTYFETEWQSICFDMTGSVDIANFTGGECGRHDGFHLFTDKFLLEILNHKTKEVHLEGAGELVLTSYLNKAMPLIRFSTRDQVKISYASCGCGLNTPRMWYRQRVDDRVILTGAIKFYVTEYINEALSHFPQVTSVYRVIISTQKEKELIELIVEADKIFVSDKRLEDKISKQIIKFSPSFIRGIYEYKTLEVPKVKIVEIGTLERFRGKIKDKIIDKRRTKPRK